MADGGSARANGCISSRPSLMVDRRPGGTDLMLSAAKPMFSRATLSLAAANSGPSTA